MKDQVTATLIQTNSPSAPGGGSDLHFGQWSDLDLGQESDLHLGHPAELVGLVAVLDPDQFIEKLH